MDELFQRFDGICERLGRAAERSARSVNSIQLVAVSKWHEAEAVAALARRWAGLSAGERAVPGLPCFGESYVQEAVEKKAEVAGRVAGCPVHWHFVGHIQSKKAKDVVGHFDLLHSLDSLKLAESLQKAWQSRVAGRPVGLAEPAPGPQAVLVQVNIGREPQKSGVDPDELEALLNAVSSMPELWVPGLMCLPPRVESSEESRPFFQRLRELRDTVEKRCGIVLPHLSMGMSSDFEAAVEEGATLVRIGTDIFGPRTP